MYILLLQKITERSSKVLCIARDIACNVAATYNYEIPSLSLNSGYDSGRI